MKSNKKSCDFVKNFKYIMLLPIVIALLAIVFGAVFGFNLDYDFRNVTTFNVKFNTTVTESEYKVLEKVLMCKFVRFNQDVTNYLYFICDDGTVKIVRILSSIEISSEDANDYKDIVNIITTLDMNVEGFEGMPVQKIKLIDINGNIYNVN